ncbi:chitooligosaccharidolytic beta-N-acetylglucosaminidase-like isoform X2 [Artemia franciscana]|nr:hypothetical protein QYM36_004528 [Artemia franciscana]KAK2720672.1 hypothetical protein QYM36_004528 [Artemia franciscana]
MLIEKMMTVLHGYFEKMEEDGLKVTVPHGADTEHELSLDIYINRCEKQITLQTNESYSLWVNTEGTSTVASIAAETCFGARHGLETLSQLISWDYAFGSLIMQTSATIIDAPAYPHRGLMVDTARNFISLEKLLHIIDGLAHDKMNTLHLHLSDANSFPFDSKRVPQMAKYGAYSPRKVYSFEDLKELGEYANVRGVRIIPEIDAPAHAGNGWQWGSEYGLGDLALCVNESPRSQGACYDPPCGILNPVNNYTYDVLESIYFDLMQALNPDMFHMGGDEVRFNCWNNTNEITEWMTLNGLSRTEEDFFHLWKYFQNTSLQRVDNVFGRDTPVILWTSSLTDQVAVNGHLDPGRYIIQVWSGSRDFTIPRLYYTGYRLIFSNVDAWYLDCGYGSWVGDGLNSCAPYKSWQVMYDNDLDYLMRGFGIRPDPGKILGGEAAMWSEQVDDATIDGKIWPRLSAVAERLWSNLPERWRFAERRFVHHRERMLLKGIMGDAVQPLWCHQNEGFCYN